MQIDKNLEIVVYTRRFDIQMFCKNIFEDFSMFSIEQDFEKFVLDPNCVSIIDASIFEIVDKFHFLKYQKNALRKTICLMPFDIEDSIKQFAAGNFPYIIPMPCNKNFFLTEFSSFEQDIQIEFLKPDDTDCEYDNESLFEFLQGNSSLIKHTRSEIIRLSQLDTPVLILGETGTGKTTAAKLIHKNSQRRHNPFVMKSVSNIEDSLADSTFFGNEAGAFTDAKATKGLFMLADTGDLFIDEIGTASMAVQAKLLSVLDDGKVTRVGGERTLKVDVRLIFATNADIEKMLTDGTFREDLYYRIAKNKLVIPPLRDRPEDIGVIAEVFAKKYGKHLLPDAIIKLEQCPWRGNVRELDTVIQNTCSKVHGTEISASQLKFF